MSKRLTTEQLTAIHYLSQPNKGGKTIEEIAKECGVSDRTVYRWMNDDTFDKELRRQAQRNVSKLVPDVVQAMYATAIKEGNAAAAKLILTVAGMLTDKIEVETKSSDAIPDIEEMRRMLAEDDTDA
ncbi:phBC6A51 family helix-turn-helix protein [Aneurinibacillus aneurinilyticus]|uniref:phBC6A51 family helix-turn-helix protein n=1 Tax=Aneurinibacillus aneurinilyticus TaxID=1391 RepID=UPI0023F3AC46|nr:phBC6A51 family helix-turn-helix protein [Aneurinibacillus aneurinilyticus]